MMLKTELLKNTIYFKDKFSQCCIHFPYLNVYNNCKECSKILSIGPCLKRVIKRYIKTKIVW